MKGNTPYQIAIVGAAGRGKTMAFRNMNPDTCGFINLEGKPLPFINKFKFYSTPNNLTEFYNVFIEYAKNETITEVVLDSFSAFADMLLKMCRDTKRGFDVWNEYNQEIGKLLHMIKKYPKDIFVSAHTDIVDSQEGTSERRIGVKGSEWNKVGIEKDFTIVNFAGIVNNDAGKKQYVLYLNSDGKDTCKTPPFLVEALGGTDYVENDANAILQTLRKILTT
jgi:hypothetical protein